MPRPRTGGAVFKPSPTGQHYKKNRLVVIRREQDHDLHIMLADPDNADAQMDAAGVDAEQHIDHAKFIAANPAAARAVACYQADHGTVAAPVGVGHAAAEVAAHINGGQWGALGLSEAEAISVMDDYLDLFAERWGDAGLDIIAQAHLHPRVKGSLDATERGRTGSAGTIGQGGGSAPGAEVFAGADGGRRRGVQAGVAGGVSPAGRDQRLAAFRREAATTKDAGRLNQIGAEMGRLMRERGFINIGSMLVGRRESSAREIIMAGMRAWGVEMREQAQSAQPSAP